MRSDSHQNQPLALRPREAARALGISERMLWTLTAAGEVPHLKVGRATLFPVHELTTWLTEKTKAAAEGGAE